MRRFTCMWFIENYSCCWHDTGEELMSPTFFVEILQSTSWNLKIYPRGCENSDFISLCLHRPVDSCGPESIALNFELSILDVNGKVIESYELEEDEFEFEKDDSYEFTNFSERLGNVLGEVNEVLSSDILKVCCTMWVGEGKIDKEDFSCARTRIGLEKISFIKIIENFNKLQPNQKKPFNVKSVSKYGLKFSGNIFVKREPDSKDEVIVEIFSENIDGDLITCQFYLLSSCGKEVECGKIDSRNYIDRMHTLSFPMNFGNNLLEKELDYLSNDNLTLRCKCTLSIGIEFQRIEETFYDLHLTPFLKENLHGSTISSFQAETKNVLEDFKNLYKDQILSDIQLKTINKAFPAHKSILCARSPVFRAMLTTNMKEKMMNCIQVDDLDESTIEQFLHFLYSGILEDLQWESALKLYYAADKYQVQQLKDICVSFLVTRLNRHNLSDLLILADRHQDSDLKGSIEKFICKKDNEIFCTDEWECFMDTNPPLAMKTMHLYLKQSRN
ncbi:unnamed protein product [Larinioides sclopetarius]|uniref:Uncharacterized protein n=1 Tax=Larinioides sclopetarius TaxID=280406 RepID=A0AAV2AJI0_9ARAC